MAVAKATIDEAARLVSAQDSTVLQLAKPLALAVRVEPTLLRAIRLASKPRLDSSAELDFWFSPLVEVRTSDWIVMRPDVAGHLRRQLLSEDKREVRSTAQRLIERAHASAPLTIQLEEAVIWAAVTLGDDALQRSEQLLRKALAQMRGSSKSAAAISRWFASAGPRLPQIVRATRAFQLLTVAASAHFEGRFIAKLGQMEPGLTTEMQQFVPADTRRFKLWVGLGGELLRISPEPKQGLHEISLPRTSPLVLEVRDTTSARFATVSLRDECNIRVTGPVIHLRTAAGDEYRLQRRPQSRDVIQTMAEYVSLEPELTLGRLRVMSPKISIHNDLVSHALAGVVESGDLFWEASEQLLTTSQHFIESSILVKGPADSRKLHNRRRVFIDARETALVIRKHQV